MLRGESDFEEPIKSNLQKWEDFFNLELHGSRFTTAGEFGGFLRAEETLSRGTGSKRTHGCGLL
jgi:hypothetical protein